MAGSHHFRDPTLSFETDADLEAGWLRGRRHKQTGVPLRIETLSCSPRSCLLVETHALHAVAASTRTTIRWSVVLGFRNPGARSDGRLITPEFEARRTPGLGPHDKAP